MSKEIDELLDAHRAWLGISVYTTADKALLVTGRLRRAREQLPATAVAAPAPEVTHQMVWVALDSIARYGEGELPPMGDLIGGPENKNYVAMRAALAAALDVMPTVKGVEDDHA